MIFMYICLNNLFAHSISRDLNRDVHGYGTRLKNNAIKQLQLKKNGGTRQPSIFLQMTGTISAFLCMEPQTLAYFNKGLFRDIC